MSNTSLPSSSGAGTLRPDLIESASPLASTLAHVIKTHHNDTQLVRELRRKVRELRRKVTNQCSL